LVFLLGQGAAQQVSNDIHIYKIGDYANFTEVDYYDKIDTTYATIIRITIITIISVNIVTILGFIGFVIFKCNKARQMKGTKPPIVIMSTP
jgi:hypothetical protein